MAPPRDTPRLLTVLLQDRNSRRAETEVTEVDICWVLTLCLALQELLVLTQRLTIYKLFMLLSPA